MHITSSRRRRFLSSAVLALALGAGSATAAGAADATASAAPAAPTAAAARCHTAWGTGAKGALPVALSKDNHLTGVRAGRHACFDRVVVDLDDRLARTGYSVRYVRAVHAEGSGDRVALRGRAAIEVILGAPAYDDRGRPTYRPRNPKELVNTRGMRTLRQVAWAGSFEGQTTIGLGVANRTPVRAFVLKSAAGDRLVIDVAHR